MIIYYICEYMYDYIIKRIYIYIYMILRSQCNWNVINRRKKSRDEVRELME